MSASPIFVAFIIALLFGTSPLIHRVATRSVPGYIILLVSSLTYLISVSIYVLIFHSKTLKTDMMKSKKWLVLLAATTFFGLFIANLLYMYVIKHTPNINITTTITALYPIITLLLATFLLKETLTPKGLVGFVFVCLGVVIMILTKKKYLNI